MAKKRGGVREVAADAGAGDAAAAGRACCSVPDRRRWPGATPAAIALLNQRVGDALLASGRANVGVTEHNGVTCLKLTLLNPVVTLDDVKVLLNLVERTAQGAAGAITCLSEAAPAAPLSALPAISR
ncbi:L-2,4-diaminobutyrate decarboxylase [Klebsiella pneumoniae]|uniref:L-2,4-diaminobutyrate decarboxylase n=1 Tax=Klebsiella pneumoniae TaxID=573 RepID=A0A377X999_KLEPN|nr:L-2,4-diaminobutyrate decarboxylase [Klebsiella pneumoniae]